MTFLVSLFGFAGRLAGDLLDSALGWASSLLFGRVPRRHQVLVDAMMGVSFLWLVLVVAVLVPAAHRWVVTTTPHPPLIGSWLSAALLAGVVVLPLVVGLTGCLVPGDLERPTGLAILIEGLRGYLLAPLIAGILLFLAGVGIARKMRTLRHRWSDAHVPIVIEQDGYDAVVADLRSALHDVGLNVVARPAPRIMSAPAWLLSLVAGKHVRALRPARLIDLEGPDLRVGIYPSDVAISGPDGTRVRARGAILERLATSAVHLTTSAEAQELEDRLDRLASSRGAVGQAGATERRAVLRNIDAALMELAVPTGEWDILYRLRLQVERDLLSEVGPSGTVDGDDVALAARFSTARPAVAAGPEPPAIVVPG